MTSILYTADLEREEACVLGYVLSAAHHADAALRAAEVMRLLSYDHFHVDKNRAVFMALSEAMRRGMYISDDSLMRAQRSLKVKSDPFDASDLVNLRLSYNSDAFDASVEALRKRHDRNLLANAAQAILDRIQTDDPDNLKRHVVRLVNGAEAGEGGAAKYNLADTSGLVLPMIEQAVDRYRNGAYVPPWPWERWNGSDVTPNLEPGFIGILAGPDGGGKTAMAEAVARHRATFGQMVTIFCLENDPPYTAMRFISADTGIPITAMRRGSLSDEQLQAIRSWYKDNLWLHNVEIVHVPNPSCASLCEMIAKREGVSDLVIVDYFQKIEPGADVIASAGGRDYRMDAIVMSRIRGAAERAKLPVFVLSQGTKAMTSGSTRRESIRGAAMVYQQAQLVMIMERPRAGEAGAVVNDRAYPPNAMLPFVRVFVDKNSIGPTGPAPLLAMKGYRIVELDEEQERVVLKLVFMQGAENEGAA